MRKALVLLPVFLMGCGDGQNCQDWQVLMSTQSWPQPTRLVEAGLGRFVGTASSEPVARELARRWCQARVESFGVVVNHLTPATGQVTSWQRVAGFSVWVP